MITKTVTELYWTISV